MGDVNEHSFLDLVRQRRSCRAYRPDPVDARLIERMLEAARLAPSACNKQPWRFAVVTAEPKRHELVRKGFMPGLGMEWALGAPVLIVLGMKRNLVTHRIAPKMTGVDYPLLDLGISGEHLVLQATELGLGTCWIGWIRAGAVRRIVDWTRDVQPVSIISLGWPADAERERTGRLSESDVVKWIKESK